MIIPNLYQKLNALVPEPYCNTWGDEYDKIVWKDSRPKPTPQDLLAVDYGLVKAKDEKQKEVISFYEKHKVFPLDIVFEKADVSFFSNAFDSENLPDIESIKSVPQYLPLVLQKDSGFAELQVDTGNFPEVLKEIVQRKAKNSAAKSFHIAKIESLLTIEEVEAYDYTLPITPIEGGATYQIATNNFTINLNDAGWNAVVIAES